MAASILAASTRIVLFATAAAFLEFTAKESRKGWYVHFFYLRNASLSSSSAQAAYAAFTSGEDASPYYFFFSIVSLGMKNIVSIPGMVMTQTMMKNSRYPTICWSQPLTKPGSIMPSAMIPVEMA